MSELKKYQVVAVCGQVEVRSTLHARDLREALEKSFKLVPSAWPGTNRIYRSVYIEEVGVTSPYSD